MSLPAQLIDDIKSVIPNFPSPGNGLSRSESKRLRFAEILKKYNLAHLIDQGGIQQTYKLIAQGKDAFAICKNPTCNSVVFGERYYCSQQCYKSDPASAELISKIKTEKYSDPEWKDSVISKSKSTFQQKYGVDYPMHDREIVKKQINSLTRSRAARKASGK